MTNKRKATIISIATCFAMAISGLVTATIAKTTIQELKSLDELTETSADLTTAERIYNFGLGAVLLGDAGMLATAYIDSKNSDKEK